MEDLLLTSRAKVIAALACAGAAIAVGLLLGPSSSRADTTPTSPAAGVAITGAPGDAMRSGDAAVVGRQLMVVSGNFRGQARTRLQFGVFRDGRWRNPRWPRLEAPRDFNVLAASWRGRPCVVRHERRGIALRCLSADARAWDAIGGVSGGTGIRSPYDVLVRDGSVYVVAGGMLKERDAGVSTTGRPVVTVVRWAASGKRSSYRVPVRLTQRGYFVDHPTRVCVEYNQYEEASGSMIGTSCLTSRGRLSRDQDAPAEVREYISEPRLEGREVGVDAAGAGVFPNGARAYGAGALAAPGSGPIVWYRTPAGDWEKGVQTEFLVDTVNNPVFVVLGRRSYLASWNAMREGAVAHELVLSVADENNQIVEKRTLEASPDGRRVPVPLAVLEYQRRVLLLYSSNSADARSRVLATDLGPAVR